jgi:hypothetical protein
LPGQEELRLFIPSPEADIHVPAPNVMRRNMTFGARRGRRLQRHPSIRSLPFFFLGWLILSCVCGFNSARNDRIQYANTDAESPAETAAQWVEPSKELPGEPYRVAVFPSGAEIFLLSPQEDDIVACPWVDVVGTAPADTVVTLNDEIAVAGMDGLFHARVPLEEGLNEIQCVASDLEGNEVAFSILIACEPEG